MEMDYVGVWPPEKVSDFEAIPTPTPVHARINKNDFLDAARYQSDLFQCVSPVRDFRWYGVVLAFFDDD